MRQSDFDIQFARHISLPEVIAHARPSFYALSLPYQRRLIRGKLVELFVSRAVARRVSRYWPADFASQPESSPTQCAVLPPVQTKEKA